MEMWSFQVIASDPSRGQTGIFERSEHSPSLWRNALSIRLILHGLVPTATLTDIVRADRVDPKCVMLTSETVFSGSTLYLLAHEAPAARS